MKKGLTEIVFIVDKSGSMYSITNDVIGGFNSYLKDQKQVDGTANVTVTFFNTNCNLLYDCVDIETVEELDNKKYQPMGGTALLDAVGMTIDSVGARLAATDESERPENVMVIIITDGEENSSREYTGKQVKEMIEHQETTFNWDFVFIAANMDAAEAGGSLGIASHKTMNFSANSADVASMAKGLSSYSKSYRSIDSNKDSLNLSSFKDK